MHRAFARSILGLLAVLGCCAVAMAQAGAGAQNTLYNRLSKDRAPGGPLPVAI